MDGWLDGRSRKRDKRGMRDHFHLGKLFLYMKSSVRLLSDLGKHVVRTPSLFREHREGIHCLWSTHYVPDTMHPL